MTNLIRTKILFYYLNKLNENQKKQNIVYYFRSLFIFTQKVEQTKIDEFIIYSSLLMNIETYILFPEQFSNHFRRYFQNFANKEKYRRKKLFSSIHKKNPKIRISPL